MKNYSLLFMLLFLAGLMSCKKDDTTEEPFYPATLDVVTTKVQQSLDSLNTSLVTAGTALATAGADSAAIRAKLKQLYAASSFGKEFCFINLQGKMQITEPPAYYQYQGADFSTDTRVMGVIQSHQPLFSDFFHAIEGFDAVDDIHPVYDGTTSLGAIETLFTPFDLLNRIIAPLVSPPNEIWAFEKNGVVIYDPDLTTIGMNIFSDPYFTPFPTFISACNTILLSGSGKTTYTFYLTGTNTPVTKVAWWKTIHLHDNAWKIIWTQQQ
jgi:hypothetical protein